MRGRQYREEVYRLRSHPEFKSNPDFEDKRDSFGRVYFSIIPFLVLEYLVELHVHSPISGLMFPTGFLLYWAFYYTYYRPGYLEEKLSNAEPAAITDLPRLLLGVAIWFVKITVVEIFRLLASWLYPGATRAPKPPPVRLAYVRRDTPPPHDHQREAAAEPPPRRAESMSALPGDVLSALHVLGLSDVRDWKVIHHRYRELAKKYHPDLNHDITAAGTRFMRFDSAYRKLLAVKARHFKE